MRKPFINKVFIPAIGLLFSTVVSAQQLYVVGPIELISKQDKQLTVLGHSLSVETCAKFTINGKKFAASQAFKLLSAESLVYAEFFRSGDKSIVTSIATVPNSYVAGASKVFVGGRITRVDVRHGTIEIGSLKIDVTAISPELAPTLTAGAFIEVSGVQPAPRGIIVSASLLGVGGSGMTQRNSKSLDSAANCSTGIGGSGVAGGSGTLGVGGSGVLSVGGSGVLGIGGSGMLSVGGSGTLGIGGSGVLSVGGSGTLGVGGSGF